MLSLGRIEVDLADFGTNRWLASSARGAVEELASIPSRFFGSRPVVDVLRRGPRQVRRRLFREARRDEDDLRAYRDLRAARPDADVEAAAGPPVDGQRLGSVHDVERVARLEGLEVAHEVVRGRVVRLGEVAHERRPLVGEQAVPVVAEREVRPLLLNVAST